MSPNFAFGKLRSFFSTKACRGVIVKSKNSDLSLLSDWMSDGKFNISVDTSFSLADASKALQKLKTGRENGKIAILIENE